MNNDTMRLLAQFTVRARKLIGPVDIKQLSENSVYREEIFKQVDSLADEELLMISISLRDALGGLEVADSSNDTAGETEQESDKKPEAGKYVFGARG